MSPPSVRWTLTSRSAPVDDGQVIDLFDSNFDRNMSCTGQWNFVTVLHSSGLRSIYGHLKKDSVVVSIGQSRPARADAWRGRKLGLLDAPAPAPRGA